jgi:hypothetical protein
MRKNNEVWKTKYGPRRVRMEAPTLQEAMFAAQGLTDDPAAQVEIAAALIGLPPDQVRAELPKQSLPTHPASAKSVVFAGPAGAPRSIVVERKPGRRGIRAAVDRSLPTP